MVAVLFPGLSSLIPVFATLAIDRLKWGMMLAL